MSRQRQQLGPWACAVFFCLGGLTTKVPAGEIPFEGFLPLVGVGLSNEFDTFDTSANFFTAQPSSVPGGQALGQGTSAYYDVALLDTGAATHILTRTATLGFDIAGEGFSGTNFQPVGGATGIINLAINDPLGIYVAGLADRNSSPGAPLSMTRTRMRGQTSFATLSGPSDWALPNIIGLPLAAQHQVHIQNSQPEIFALNGRTVRTPQIELRDLGSGGQGILRRAPLILNPGMSFITGPIYSFTLDPFSGNLNLHDNPLSPSVVQNGGLFIEVDLTNNGQSLQDAPLLFDTGASLTVVSEQTAVRLGFDPILDTPDFTLSVEGSGGVSTGIPGFYLDELNIDTIGGRFTLNDIPIAVLDVTNPSDPGNVISGILGMNVFAGRDLVIDSLPSAGQGGVGPSLYISDPVTTQVTWATTAANGSWSNAGNWSPDIPGVLADVRLANIRGSAQRSELGEDTTIFRGTVTGGDAAEMSLQVNAGATLTLFADLAVRSEGRLHLAGGRVDAQFVDLDGGQLTGSGELAVGSGPLPGSVRNLGGRIAPGDAAVNPIGNLQIQGDLSSDGTLAFDLGGTLAGTSYDVLSADRFVFLDGTLEVNLVDLGGGAFQPSIGDTFTLITAGDSVQGAFESLLLPSGYTWSVNYLATSVRLELTGIGLVGDFNGDGILDCGDIDLLTAASAAGDNTPLFDLTGDGLVNQSDLDEWVTHLYGTIPGDANLDGFVDVTDFNVWNGHKFSATAAWCQGDFNGDGSVDVSDFNVWNSNRFRSSQAVVPEPCLGALWAGMAMLLLVGTSRKSAARIRPASAGEREK